jgi:hypothetical protein
MVDGQAADQAKGFSSRLQRLGHKLEVIVVARQPGKEAFRSHRESFSTRMGGRNSFNFRHGQILAKSRLALFGRGD